MKVIALFVLFMGLAHCAVAQIGIVSTVSVEPTPAPVQACQCVEGGECTCENCQCQAVKFVSVKTGRSESLFDFADLKKLPKSLGYGTSDTRAPIPDALGTLVALNNQGGYDLIDQHHQSPQAARPVPAVTSKPASPRIQQVQYRRVYVGMSCGAGGCQPQYRWEAVPVSYSTPATVYVPQDSIGGTAPQAQSYSDYGCAGAQGYGCSGSGSAGCSGVSGRGPLRRLFGRR